MSGGGKPKKGPSIQSHIPSTPTSQMEAFLSYQDPFTFPTQQLHLPPRTDTGRRTQLPPTPTPVRSPTRTPFAPGPSFSLNLVGKSRSWNLGAYSKSQFCWGRPWALQRLYRPILQRTLSKIKVPLMPKSQIVSNPTPLPLQFPSI